MPLKKLMTRAEYEKNAKSLMGKSIVRIVYHEIDYEDGQFHFFDDSRFDTLDYGLEIRLDTGENISIIWGAEFYQYGISLNNSAMSAILSSSRSLDVSKTSRCKYIINRMITSVDVFWSWCEESGKPESRIYYPQDLLIGFEKEQQIIISALEIREGDWSIGMTDNITLFFDAETAKLFKCLA